MTNKIQTNDEKIKALLKTVEEKRKALGTKPRARWVTNGLFKGSNDTFNLNIVKSTDRLVHALASLVVHKEATEVAARMLGVDAPDVKQDGYTILEWSEDFKLRMNILNYDKRKKELTSLEAKLKKLISEGTRTEMELADIAELLG